MMERQENQRLYHRFNIVNPKLCFVELSPTISGQVKTLSYGGLGITLNSQPVSTIKSVNKSSQPLSIGLTFLNKTISCLVDERFSIKGDIGYQFFHEQTHVLNFLKEIIPWVRAGAAFSYLQKIERDGLDEEIPEHLSFEGPLPFEMEWKSVDSNKVPNFSIKFKQDKVLYQLNRKNDQLSTLHNVWPGAESGDLRPTLALDETILRAGMAILLGLAQDQENETYKKMLDVSLDIFEKEKVQTQTFFRKKTG